MHEGRRRCRPAVTIGWALFVLIGHSHPGFGQSDQTADSIQITKINIGIDGHYRVGRWTPISVTFTGAISESVQLSVWVPDPDGNLTKQPSKSISLTGRGPHTLQSVFRTGRMDGIIRVEISSGETIFASQLVLANQEHDDESITIRPPHTLRTEIWVLLGEATGFEQAAEVINERDASRRKRDPKPVTLISLQEPTSLPTLPQSLEAVEVLTVGASVTWDEASLLAVRRWVEQGGHLVVSSGVAEEWDANPLSAWVPIHVIGQSRLRDLSGLTSQLIRPNPFRTGSFEALRFNFDFGETLAETRDGPLWVRMPFGLGRITLLGMDLGRRPFVGWDTLPQLCERMTDYQRPGTRNRQNTTAAQLSRTGITDLSTQLAVAVDNFPQMAKPANWKIMGLIVLYLLVIGPIDYVIVHYLLRRPHWTWVTFPLIVLASVLMATSSADHAHSDGLLANQFNLIDVDVSSGLTRTSVWSSFISPETKRHAVRAEFTDASTGNVPAGQVDAVSPMPRLSWLGIPENGFRGMYRTGGLDLAKPKYAFSPDLTSIEDLPVSVQSSSSLNVSRFHQSSSPDGVVESHLQGAGNQLSGTLTNRLSVPIQDWFIAHRNLVYYPKGGGDANLDIEPGETLSIADDPRITPRVLRNYLKGVTRVTQKIEGQEFDDITILSDTYDPLDRDCYRILRAVTFYRSGGGQEMLSLSNDQWRRLDLSPFLHLDRAVLYGRISLPPATVVVDGEPLKPVDSQTIIRILLPVPRSR